MTGTPSPDSAVNDVDATAFRRRMENVAQLMRRCHSDATAVVVQILGSRTSLIAVLGTDENGHDTELWNFHDSDDWPADDDLVAAHLTAATPHANHQVAGELSWTRHDEATYRAPLPPARRPWARLYVDTADASPHDRQVMPPATASTGIDDTLPYYSASTSLTGHSVFTGLATLDRAVLGRVGNTVREAVSFNGGHTLIGFLAITDDGRFHATPRDLGLDPSSGPRPGGVDIDEDTDPATSALLLAADSPRQWFGPFDSRGLAEPFLLGWAGGNGLIALTPPPVPDEDTRKELLGRLSTDEIAGIGSSLVGRPVDLLDDYDLLAVYELSAAGCQAALVRDVRGLYAFVCGTCEHGDFADCPHECPIGYCHLWQEHKVGYSFDQAGAVAWHRTQIGR